MGAVASQYFSAILCTVAFAVYGIFEYHRREQNHKMKLLALKYGKEPPKFDAKPELWKLLTTGFVALILLVSAVGFVVWRHRIVFGGGVMYILAFFFLAIFSALLINLIRDTKAYLNWRRTEGEVSPWD